VQKLLERYAGRDFFFYSFSLKPEEDSPAALKEFAERHRTRPGWLFLTGTPATMEIVRKSLGFTYSNPEEDADKSRHVGMLRLGDEAAARWGTCPARANPKHIARSIGEEFGFGFRAGTRVI
jgi:protein SCO1/2